jgi:hypothetical protein
VRLPAVQLSLQSVLLPSLFLFSLSLSLSLSFFLYFALSNMAEQTDKKELKKQKKTKQHKKNNIKQKHRRPCSLTTSNTINNTAGVSTTW